MELVLWISVGADEFAKISVFHTPNNLLYLMVFINEYILLSFPFTSSVSCLSSWSIVLMHITWTVKCCLCYFRYGCKQLLRKVRKFGRSVHTLIHPPSVWVLCPTNDYKVFHWKNTIQMKYFYTENINCAKLFIKIYVFSKSI